MSQANQNNSTNISIKSLTRREAVSLSVSGAVAVVAGGVALASSPDPIFAAIEAHKAAHHRFISAVDISGSLYHTDPQYEQAEQATVATGDALENASIELTNVMPETFAGVLALLSYVDDFNLGKIGRSEHHLWPDELTDEDALDAKGYALTLPFPFWLMRNIHMSLQKLGNV